MNLKDAGIDLGLAIAGLFGSILMSSKQAGANLPRAIASLVGGAASANYVTPLLLKIAHLEGEPQYGYAAGFLLGFCGLRAVETLSEKLIPTNEPHASGPRKRARK
jgi:hypothetical protein